MSHFHLDRLLEFFASLQLVVAMLWGGLAIFTVILAILMYSRWGQYHPLRKCMALSLLAHLLLAGYSTTIEIAAPAPPHVFHVSLYDSGSTESDKAEGRDGAVARSLEQPWEAFPNDAVVEPAESDLARGEAAVVEPKRLVRAENAQLPGEPALNHLALVEVKPSEPKSPPSGRLEERTSPSESATPIDAPAAQRREAPQPTIPTVAASTREREVVAIVAQPARTSSRDEPSELLQVPSPLPRMADSSYAPDPADPLASLDNLRPNPIRRQPITPRIAGRVVDSSSDGLDRVAVSTPSLTAGRNSSDVSEEQAIPDAYRLRVAPDRADVTRQQGGSAETEAAVKTALKWLADHQSAEGHWDPRTFGAGKDTSILGHSHDNAGGQADTGMTGLALLAFLGSGHTHRDGPSQDNVRRGLEFLLRSQARDGNLGGQAAMYEAMYCHAMATCALSEAYGMTHDERLRSPVTRAIAYTVAAQDPAGGGWRYKPGMAGDTSQLGWQLMSLKSAELAGIPMSQRTREGIIRYLQSVSTGTHGGKASYRPGEQVTRTMSAEALVCWLFLGLSRDHAACSEAGELLLGELPGEGTDNLYYWYYATLGMYQLQGTYWERWNEALRKTLISRQVKEGSMAGSWDNSNDLWGGHGGRIYTTALATLSLEVYYRFLPLYSGVSVAESRRK